MHMGISALVFANSEEEALSKAETVFERLVENGNYFDYYKILNGQEDMPIAIRADSAEGKKIIQDSMNATKFDFMSNIKIIRELLESHTDEMLFSEKQNLFEDQGKGSEVDMFRHYCYCIGEYRGPNVWLYDQDGEGIRTKKHLEHVLSKWGSPDTEATAKNPFAELDLWVISADVHF